MLKKEFNIGNKIKTNKGFMVPTERMEDDDHRVYVKSEKEYFGIVVDVVDDQFLSVAFDESADFLEKIKKSSEDIVTYYVPFAHAEIVEQYKNKDKKIQSFVNSYLENVYFKAVSQRNSVKELLRQTRDCKNSIESHSHSIKNLVEDLNEATIKLNTLYANKKEADSINYDSIENIYNKLLKNKKIRGVEAVKMFDNNYLMITTDDLTFVDNTRDLPSFDIGAFKIAIPLFDTYDYNDIQVTNYKKHWGKKYFHPCIPSSFRVCLGPLGEDMSRLLSEKNYSSIAHMMINFLEEPAYGKPHVSGLEFYCAQDVTMSPRNPEKWFDRDYWEKTEVWNGEDAAKMFTEIKKTYSGNKK